MRSDGPTPLRFSGTTEVIVTGAMHRPIFVISNYRSGSTLVRYLLDVHPQVCCPAELRLGALCQQLFNVAELLSADAADGAWTGDRMQKRLETVRNVVETMMVDHCLQRNKERWSDKSPANCETLHVLQRVFPDAQYICLHRRPLDQVRSTLEIDGIKHISPYLSKYRGDVVAAAVDRWCTITERILALEHQQHGSTLRITYEDLVNDPESEMERVMRFLGIAVVSGLSQEAFRRSHDQGPADWKISGTSEVLRTRVGGGRGIAAGGLPADLERRLAGLVGCLRYPVDVATR